MAWFAVAIFCLVCGTALHSCCKITRRSLALPTDSTSHTYRVDPRFQLRAHVGATPLPGASHGARASGHQWCKSKCWVCRSRLQFHVASSRHREAGARARAGIADPGCNFTLQVLATGGTGGRGAHALVWKTGSNTAPPLCCHPCVRYWACRCPEGWHCRSRLQFHVASSPHRETESEPGPGPGVR